MLGFDNEIRCLMIGSTSFSSLVTSCFRNLSVGSSIELAAFCVCSWYDLFHNELCPSQIWKSRIIGVPVGADYLDSILRAMRALFRFFHGKVVKTFLDLRNHVRH